MRPTTLLRALIPTHSSGLDSASEAASPAAWLRQLPFAVFTFAALALAWFA